MKKGSEDEEGRRREERGWPLAATAVRGTDAVRKES